MLRERAARGVRPAVGGNRQASSRDRFASRTARYGAVHPAANFAWKQMKSLTLRMGWLVLPSQLA